MLDLIKMVVANLLLNLYFAIDIVFGLLFPQTVYIRTWEAYDWIYRVAVKISPYDIPPIYEGFPVVG